MISKEANLAELMQLPPEERLEAATRLFDSLEAEGEIPDWESLWSQKLQHRLEGLKNGTREPVDAATVFSEARARLQRE